MKYKKTVKLAQSKNLDEFNLTDILESYILFLVSNPDFKYNQTYFTDELIHFKESLDLLHSRANTFKKIADKMMKIQKKRVYITNSVITFDSIYKYTLSDKIKAEIVSDSSDFKLHDYWNQPIKLEITINTLESTKDYAYIFNKKDLGKELTQAIIDNFEKIIYSNK